MQHHLPRQAVEAERRKRFVQARLAHVARERRFGQLSRNREQPVHWEVQASVCTGLAPRGRAERRPYDFTLDSEEHERALLGSLRENFPFVANLDESQILFVDCRATGDPASDKSLRDHLGTYPPNMKHTTTNPKWVDWWKEVVPSAHRLLTEKEEPYVFLFCTEDTAAWPTLK